MSEAQPPEFPTPKCSGLAVGALLFGLFSGPIWLVLFIVAVCCGASGTWGALGLLCLVQGIMLLVSVVAWVCITRAKGVHDRGFVVIGLVLALMWAIAIWAVVTGMGDAA